VAEIDVVVVGAGIAGLTAALSAQEDGANVLVAESEPIVGGASRLSGGMILAAGTDVQRAGGLEDDPAWLYQEYLLVNQYEVPPGIVRRIAYESGPAIEWLEQQGVQFIPGAMQGGGERVPRSHVPAAPDLRSGGGQHIVDVLHQRCRERKVEVALRRRVDRLLVDGDAAAGVAVGDDELEAGAVVIATGGFGANRELIEKYLPTYARNAGDWAFYIGPDSARGDGIMLGEQAGAGIAGFDRWVPNLAPNAGLREADAYLPAWMLIVGPDGRRLMDETAPYGVTYGIVNDAGGRVWGFFDARIRADNGSPELPTVKAEFAGRPLLPHVWNRDEIDRMVESGAIVEEDTLEEVVRVLGLPEERTPATVRRYNGHVAAGEDRDFRKDPRWLRPIETPPFYGVEIRPAALGITTCGLEIDEAGQVISEGGEPISGLYAAGECTGGVLGTRYVGSGNGIASCLVFGRAAGHSAAAYALKR
jgi:succinate dehydrogenase/fumarate reductase flavoprotein subunit